MPLRARRYPLFWDTNLYKHPQGRERFQANEPARLLFRDRDSENMAPFENLGNVLLVQDDRKPLHPSHLRALLQFSVVTFCFDERDQDAHRKIFDAVTPRAFLDYWGGFVARYVEYVKARATLFDVERDDLGLEDIDAPDLIGL